MTERAFGNKGMFHLVPGEVSFAKGGCLLSSRNNFVPLNHFFVRGKENIRETTFCKACNSDWRPKGRKACNEALAQLAAHAFALRLSLRLALWNCNTYLLAWNHCWTQNMYCFVNIPGNINANSWFLLYDLKASIWQLWSLQWECQKLGFSILYWRHEPMCWTCAHLQPAESMMQCLVWFCDLVDLKYAMNVLCLLWHFQEQSSAQLDPSWHRICFPQFRKCQVKPINSESLFVVSYHLQDSAFWISLKGFAVSRLLQSRRWRKWRTLTQAVSWYPQWPHHCVIGVGVRVCVVFSPFG